MSIGVSTAIGLVIGAAYGSSTQQLAFFTAIGTAAGATLGFHARTLGISRFSPPVY